MGRQGEERAAGWGGSSFEGREQLGEEKFVGEKQLQAGGAVEPSEQLQLPQWLRAVWVPGCSWGLRVGGAGVAVCGCVGPLGSPLSG